MFQQEQVKQQLHQQQGVLLQPQGYPQGIMIVPQMQYYPEPVVFQVDQQIQQQVYNHQPSPQTLVVQPSGLMMVPNQQPLEQFMFQHQQQLILHQQQRQHHEMIFHQQQRQHHEMIFHSQQQQQKQLQNQHQHEMYSQKQQKLMVSQQLRHPQLENLVEERKKNNTQSAVEKKQQELQKSQVKLSKIKKKITSTAISSLPYPVDLDIPSGDELSYDETIVRPPYQYQSFSRATRSYSETVASTVQTPQRKRSSYASILHSPQSESPPGSSSSPHYQLHTHTSATTPPNPRLQFLEPVTNLEYINTENLQDLKIEDYSLFNPFHLHSKQILRRNLRCPVLSCPWSQRICGREELRKHHFKTHLSRGRIDKSIHPVAAELIAQLLYKCLVTGCGRIYSRGDSLKKHIKLVHEKPTSRFNKSARLKLLKVEDQGMRDAAHSLS
ncbi:hypothetical protein CLIB1423_51S00122 [[Candida] railenensis]|uniref:C2H2-type domain-containing protein n=1 Tax=[Candida] railenensis TaxID=45579 RepID=A0A9P0QW36_9ASCO|nr:hypothetical protein CLIB1423_51S00122 [[Candida] railenensis]